MSEEKKENIENLSFEKKIEKAKELLEKLSDPEITLSDSLDVYKKGIKELEEAQKLLDEAKLIFTKEEKDSNEPF
jgi:exodeoxyribonuclease VII small subunit